MAKRKPRARGKRHVVKEIRTTIRGKPAVIRVYEKGWKYKNLMVATVHVGKTKMYEKSPRMGKKKKKR